MGVPGPQCLQQLAAPQQMGLNLSSGVIYHEGQRQGCNHCVADSLKRDSGQGELKIHKEEYSQTFERHDMKGGGFNPPYIF
jgi:hypothetical protein